MDADRLFAACGLASVVLLLAGSFLGSAGGQPSYTLGSSPARIAHELAQPVDPLGWAGAYVELLSFGCFLAFVVWACARLGGGLLGAIGRPAGLGYATINVTALCVMDALAYRAGHGVDAQLGTALASGRRPLGWIVYASVSLARRGPAREAAAVATSRGYVASPR